MKHLAVIVSGSRYLTLTDSVEVFTYLDTVLSIVRDKYRITIIEGGARGADALAKQYAEDKRYDHLQIKADWGVYGRKAGILRNIEMLKFATNNFDKVCLVAFPTESSIGTRHMIKICKNIHRRVLEIKKGGV